MKTVNCEGVEYLTHEATGNAARFIIPMALEYCKGDGLDIGCARYEWALPGALQIDPVINEAYDAMNLPGGHWGNVDYIFSSHCLEHIKENWMNVLDYWLTKIKVGGILFLYLPHSSQRYWQPRNNRKHVHSFNGDEIGEYLKGLGHQVFVSGVDLNHSFAVVCEKREAEPEIGSKEYYDKKRKCLADELENALIKQGRAHFRDGDNVTFNGPNPLDLNRADTVDSHGDVLMPGCFDKSINKIIGNTFMPDLGDKIADMRLKSEKQINSEIDESVGRFCIETKSYTAATYEAWINFNKVREQSLVDSVPFDIWIKYIANV